MMEMPESHAFREGLLCDFREPFAGFAVKGF
jgi:hypothetical protein